MSRISDWYDSLGEYSFPTVFLRLGQDERTALVEGAMKGAVVQEVTSRLQRAIRALPGSGFVGADSCVPTDSPWFGKAPSVSSGRAAWRLLTSSEKVRAAFMKQDTERLTMRPFRRMDRAREFRMFFVQRRLVAMSQYCLVRHFGRLAKREAEIWRKGLALAQRMAPWLPEANQVVDVYLCSDGNLLLVDLNQWGDPTDPKLLKTWERDWDGDIGLKLIPRPIKMKGDISVTC